MKCPFLEAINTTISVMIYLVYGQNLTLLSTHHYPFKQVYMKLISGRKLLCAHILVT